MLPDVVDGENIRMVERSGRTGFLLEAMETFRIGGERRWQDFDRHVAPEARVARAVDFAHAAASKRGDDLISAETNAGRERHGLSEKSAGLYLLCGVNLGRICRPRSYLFRFPASFFDRRSCHSSRSTGDA
jgi:hypothetical protein